MTSSWFRRFARDESAAVAATYALLLVPIVGLAGVGYDFAQMAALDTELQGAADQAALAAATQLSGKSTAIADATSAASALVSNSSVMANDGKAATITVSTLTFYPSATDADAGTNATTDATKAKAVTVELSTRKARFTLTPIVGLITSPDMVASASAGVGSAICSEPPLFVCKPTGAITNAVDWVNNNIGKGVLLKAKGTSWTPGNFGFLETNAGSGANAISQLMAYATPPGECTSVDAPQTAPGQKQSVVADFNTRFDIYENGDNINCWSSDGLCPPAANSRKDIVQPTTAAPTKLKDCNSPASGWAFSNRPYRPTSATMMSGATAADFPDAMGYPRDLCHATPESAQNCADGFIGNGSWDINAFWWANYGSAWSGSVATSVSGRSYPTRYELYQWEKANAASYRDIPSTTMRNYKGAICRTPSATAPDRRVVPIAIVDCSTLGNGGGVTTLNPIGWMDVFLVEPSLDRDGKDAAGKNATFTSKGDFYGEIVRYTGQGSGGAGAQIVRRDKPFLIK